jgi:hypothetical protein
MAKFVVLSDGETYTSLQGCRVMEVPDAVVTALDAPDSEDDLDSYLKDRYRAGEGQPIDELKDADELEDAFTDLLDGGNYQAVNIVASTGLPQERAEEIEALYLALTKEK